MNYNFRMDMKRILYIFASAVMTLLFSVSCEKDENYMMEQMAGDWHYSAEENGVTEDVWVSFAADGTFEMYQKIGGGAYWYSTGEFVVGHKSGTVSGVYSDRYPWKYSYKVSVNGKKMVMTAVETDSYSVTYTRGSIPSEVRQMSLPLTRSEQMERHL